MNWLSDIGDMIRSWEPKSSLIMFGTGVFLMLAARQAYRSVFRDSSESFDNEEMQQSMRVTQLPPRAEASSLERILS